MDKDLVGDIWQDRPKMSCQPVWELELCYAGRSRSEKIERIRSKLYKEGADSTIISSLEDIAWTLNIRGSDINCTPVAISYLVIEKTSVLWFVQMEAVNKTLQEKLYKDGINLYNYHQISDYLLKKSGNQIIYLDPDRTNMSIYQILASRKEVSEEILEGKNLTLVEKAVKNNIEIENMRLAHRKDAVACIKFIYWLKKQINGIQENQDHVNQDTDMAKKINGNNGITETLVAKKLEEFRATQENYVGPSFDTIVGYAHHGAIIHYHALPETDLLLKADRKSVV